MYLHRVKKQQLGNEATVDLELRLLCMQENVTEGTLVRTFMILIELLSAQSEFDPLYQPVDNGKVYHHVGMF